MLLRDGDDSVAATLQNLSLAGIGCTCSREFALGRSLTVVLELSDGEADSRECWSLPAQVVRCLRQRRASARPRFQLGLVFGELEDEQRASIKAFLGRCLVPIPSAP